ncbi:MAG: phytoene synthase [Patiriisocius sp.]|jgi:phytoene synthase
MKELFDKSSVKCSELITKSYSTSFSLGIKMFAPSLRPPIYSIYGFVRYADEIVDSFHDYEQEELLTEFIVDYKKALDRKISLNPILNSFQKIVREYNLFDLADSFLESMTMDLTKAEYQSEEQYKKYIYGSADVVGLMCLKVFVKGDESRYEELKPQAMSLGSAFQKVNFLRDIRDDFNVLGRSYFPNVTNRNLDAATKNEIIADIEKDFQNGYQGITQLPLDAKLGVYLAYRYYLSLLNKLKAKESSEIMNARIRVSSPIKMVILFKSFVRFKMNMI